MASRRVVVSAVNSAAAAAVHPAAWRVTARQCASIATRAQSFTAVAFMSASTTRAITTRGALAVRFYSAGNAKPEEQQQEEDRIPGSKRWEFEDITKQLETGEDANVIFVDVREPMELRETGKIPGAINIPITTAVQSFHISDEDFEALYGFERPTKDKTLVFYCKAGVRAKTAAGLARHAGWNSLGEYTGSWIDWAKKNGPVEKVKGGY